MIEQDKTKSSKSDPTKRSFDLTIAGLPFRLRSSHDEATVQALVEFVDAKINQAMSYTKSGSFQSAAILAALNIAEELILLKKRAVVELSDLEDRAIRISEDLELITQKK